MGFDDEMGKKIMSCLEQKNKIRRGTVNEKACWDYQYYNPRTDECIEKKSKIISNQFYFTFVHIVKCKLHKLAHALTPYRSPSPQILRMVTSLCRRKSPQRILPPMLLSTGAATISLPLPPINRETICSRRTTPPRFFPIGRGEWERD